MNWGDDDLDLALRDLRDEELPLGSVEAVRARVMEQVSKPRRRWWLWAWAPALAAALAVVWLRPQPDIPPPPVIATAPPAPAYPLATARGSIARTAATRRERFQTDRTREPQTAAQPQTRFVKLITDDPDVVILWAMNSEGDSQ